MHKKRRFFILTDVFLFVYWCVTGLKRWWRNTRVRWQRLTPSTSSESTWCTRRVSTKPCKKTWVFIFTAAPVHWSLWVFEICVFSAVETVETMRLKGDEEEERTTGPLLKMSHTSYKSFSLIYFYTSAPERTRANHPVSRDATVSWNWNSLCFNICTSC